MTKRARGRIGLGLLLLVGVIMITGSVGAEPTLGPPVGPIALQCTTGPTFNLETATGHIYTPDGNSVLMWSFTTNSGSFQLPSPVLCVTQGDTVMVNLTNYLDEPVSIVFPGQGGVGATGDLTGLFTAEAAACTGAPPCTPGTASYTFTASEPGTYLYESGTDPHKQIEMGLYGALIVYPNLTPPAGVGYAYNSSTAYEAGREYLIILHEIDPELHLAVEQGLPYDATAFHPTYWTVNGRAFPDSIAENYAPWLPNQPYGALVQVRASAALPALIRYANAGLVNHPFHPHGNHLRVIARDGRLLADDFEDFTRTIGSGQTYDLLFKWEQVDAWISPGGTPVPVTIPGLQNLVFKDGATFYSGDPELGETDKFPVDVVTYSECGEFYFPWHSHALFEFTNFDEGFGGLATLLRVEPPGGCP